LDETGMNLLGTRVHPPVDDPSWQIDRALEPRPGEIVVNKLSAGTFATTDLAEQLRRRGVVRVVVSGVVTDVCVSTTAREAADRNFKVVVVSDACTTFSEELHRANLEPLHVFGWVRETDEVIRLTQKARATSRRREQRPLWGPVSFTVFMSQLPELGRPSASWVLRSAMDRWWNAELPKVIGCASFVVGPAELLTGEKSEKRAPLAKTTADASSKLPAVIFTVFEEIFIWTISN
jgi:hypothetical protein